jgi:hypothetical protein
MLDRVDGILAMMHAGHYQGNYGNVQSQEYNMISTVGKDYGYLVDGNVQQSLAGLSGLLTRIQNTIDRIDKPALAYTNERELEEVMNVIPFTYIPVGFLRNTEQMDRPTILYARQPVGLGHALQFRTYNHPEAFLSYVNAAF